VTTLRPPAFAIDARQNASRGANLEMRTAPQPNEFGEKTPNAAPFSQAC